MQNSFGNGQPGKFFFAPLAKKNFVVTFFGLFVLKKRGENAKKVKSLNSLHYTPLHPITPHYTPLHLNYAVPGTPHFSLYGLLCNPGFFDIVVFKIIYFCFSIPLLYMTGEVNYLACGFICLFLITGQWRLRNWQHNRGNYTTPTIYQKNQKKMGGVRGQSELCPCEAVVRFREFAEICIVCLAF